MRVARGFMWTTAVLVPTAAVLVHLARSRPDAKPVSRTMLDDARKRLAGQPLPYAKTWDDGGVQWSMSGYCRRGLWFWQRPEGCHIVLKPEGCDIITYTHTEPFHRVASVSDDEVCRACSVDEHQLFAGKPLARDAVATLRHFVSQPSIQWAEILGGIGTGFLKHCIIINDQEDPHINIDIPGNLSVETPTEALDAFEELVRLDPDARCFRLIVKFRP